MAEPPRARELPRCPVCDAEVRCGMALGEQRCWCMDLPPARPLATDRDGARCLCPDCLRQHLRSGGSAGS